MTFILSIPIEVRLAVVCVLGCCLGAAINLGIYRLAWTPRPISPWLRPQADAPPRRFWDRVPVLGWLGLRREAGLHGPGFWIRPMFLELLTGAALALLYGWEVDSHGLIPTWEILAKFRQGIFMPGVTDPLGIALPAIRHEQFLAHAVLFCFMLVAFWIDFDEWTIPDGVTIPGTLAGLVIVTLCPFALLPQSADAVNDGSPGLMVSSVWLNSPDEIPPPPRDLISPPRYVMPWESRACTGWPALVAAITAFWAWCLALLPGRWYRRHGYIRAVKIFTARMVRHWMTYVLLVLAVLGSIAIAWIWRMGGPHWAGLASSLAGIVVGGGLVWLVRILATFALRREAMGFGDVTLVAMIGAFLGWQAAVVVFFVAPLAAVLIGVGRLLLRGEREIPYGPFLCLATVATVLAWPAIWEIGSLGTLHEKPICYPYFTLGWTLIAVLIGCLCLLVVLLPPVRWALSKLRRT